MIRVTQVLDYMLPGQLSDWFKRNSKAKCEAIGEETARIGNEVDKLVQEDIDDGGYIPPEGDEQVNNCLKGWEAYKKQEPLFVQSVAEMQTEISDGEFVGHPDFINRIGHTEWGISDLKCTSGIREKNWVQCAKYAEILMIERGWTFPAFIRIIRLQRTSEIPEVVTVSDPKFIQYCMNMFKVYAAIYRMPGVMADYFRGMKEAEVLGISNDELGLIERELKEEIFDGKY